MRPTQSSSKPYSVYVDDNIAGATSIDAALKFYREFKNILKKGGFNLRKFRTNLPQLQIAIDELKDSLLKGNSDTTSTNETTYAKSALCENHTINSADQKVFGTMWNTTTDCLVFSVEDIAALAEKVSEPTKRIVTSIIGRFYDLLGFLSPIVVKFKMFFFNTLCKQGGEWDQALSGDILLKWQTLTEGL